MEIRHAAKYSMNNRQAVVAADHCGCYHCLAEFSPVEIKEWVDDQQTAICPFCSVDSILPDGPSTPISRDFLEKLRNYWF